MPHVTCPHCRNHVQAIVENTKKPRAIRGAMIGLGLAALAVGTGGIGIAAAGTAIGLSGAATGAAAGALVGAATGGQRLRCPKCRGIIQ